MSRTAPALVATMAIVLAGLTFAPMAAAQCDPAYCPTSSSITDDATDVGPNSATLNGRVNPNGSTTTYHFELGGGPAGPGRAVTYTYSSPDGTLPGDDNPHAVSAKVAGLAPNTVYHFRVVSKNQSGFTDFGADKTFTTPNAASSGGGSTGSGGTGGTGGTGGAGGQPTTSNPTTPTFNTPSQDTIINGRHVRRGTSGNNCITFLTAAGVLFGDAGDDVLQTGRFDDIAYGGPGDDYLALGTGKDVGHGDAGDDQMYGDRSTIPPCAQGTARGASPRAAGKTGSNADRLNGSAGDDRIFGEAGNDRLTGGPGKDRISGGSGNDEIWSRDGERDTVTCGTGTDVVHADPQDKVGTSCERVRRSTPKRR